MPIIAIALFGVVIALFNRKGKVTVAGLLYTLAIDIGVTVSTLTQPHGITNRNIPDFDIFALSILLVGLILQAFIYSHYCLPSNHHRNHSL